MEVDVWPVIQPAVAGATTVSPGPASMEFRIVGSASYWFYWSYNRGCYVCDNFGCHTRYHTEDAVSPQAPPALPCQVCGQFGCHVTCHEGNVGAPTSAVSTQTVNSAPGPETNAVRPPSNSGGVRPRATGLRQLLLQHALRPIKAGLCLYRYADRPGYC